MSLSCYKAKCFFPLQINLGGALNDRRLFVKHASELMNMDELVSLFSLVWWREWIKKTTTMSDEKKATKKDTWCISVWHVFVCIVGRSRMGSPLRVSRYVHVANKSKDGPEGRVCFVAVVVVLFSSAEWSRTIQSLRSLHVGCTRSPGSSRWTGCFRTSYHFVMVFNFNWFTLLAVGIFRRGPSLSSDKDRPPRTIWKVFFLEGPRFFFAIKAQMWAKKLLRRLPNVPNGFELTDKVQHEFCIYFRIVSSNFQIWVGPRFFHRLLLQEFSAIDFFPMPNEILHWSGRFSISINGFLLWKWSTSVMSAPISSNWKKNKCRCQP